MATSGEDVFLEQIDASIGCLQDARVLGPQVAAAARLMADVFEAGGKLLVCGNGGSAADSSHFTTELLCRLKDDRPPLAAISLSADPSFLSATSNDYGYEEVFARQVQGLGQESDVLVVISTSGNSANIVHALKIAKESGLKTVAMLGRDGGQCAGLANIEIIVPHPSTARIQETHQVIVHTLCLLIEHHLFQMKTEL